jgi:hypothetical protein
MKSVSTLVLSVLTLGSGLARAQNVDSPSPETANAQAVQAPSAAPVQLPPAPPEQLPPPPQQVQQAEPDPAQAAGQQAPATGQWVYTQQYGWVWMPYGDQYTYSPTQAGTYPQEYVYSPSYGWSWLAAPWVFGWGVSPYWGVYGPAHFGWYGRLAGGGFRGYNGGYGYRNGYGGYGYRGGYAGRPAYGGGYRGGYAAPRSGYGPAAHVYGRAPVGSFGAHPGFQGGGGFSGGHGGGFGGGSHGSGFSGGHGGGFGGGHGGGFGGGHGGHR